MSDDNRPAADIIDIKSRTAQLIVRGLDPIVVRALKLRAAHKGVSAEAEHRAILREALLPGRSLESALFAVPDVGDEEFAIEGGYDL